jgi:perosamine synthetase
MQASKSLPAGEGGMMVTNDRRYFERALLLAQSPGRLKLHIQLDEHRPFIETGFGGFKYRINVLNAVIARMQLPKLEEWNAIRQRNMDRLAAGLAGVPGIEPAYTAPHVTRGGFYGYPILYKPEELAGLPMATFLEAVQAEGVPLKRERYPMLHLCPMFRQQNPAGGGWPWSFSEATRAVTYKPGDLPVTERLYPRLLHIESWDKAEPCEELFEQYAQGIRKVAENARQLAAHA